jgi:glucose/mannose-6-phosphate isomerase
MSITRKKVSSVDKKNMFSVLKNFHNQISEAVRIGNKFKPVKLNSANIKNIIITGLGGSAIGGDLLRSYTQEEIKIPVTVNRNYVLPKYAGKNTLVVISSYSGDTEESVSAYVDAVSKDCKILCITSGGMVEQIAAGYNHNLIKIPGGLQPRCAIGYSFFCLLIAFSKLNLIKNKSKDITDSVNTIKKLSGVYSSLSEKNNPAIRIAKKLKGKLPVIYSAVDTLDVVNLRWRGQFSENAKMLAYGNLYPEMNHNEIVGWKLNKDILKKISVIFLRDITDNRRIGARMNITKSIYRELSDSIIELSSNSHTFLARVFDFIYLGDWVSFYLAILNNVDPTPVDVISNLKKELSKC